jgi:uncharacterized protein YbjT (DUF2867 family)
MFYKEIVSQLNKGETMTTKSVTVFGATGTAGREYVKALSAAGHKVKGTIRTGADPSVLEELGATPVEVDLSLADGAMAAVQEADAIVISLLGRGGDPAGDEAISTRSVLAAAVRAQTQRIIYTSVHLADAETGVAHFDVKGELELDVLAAGLPFTVLRPTTFMEGLDAPWLRTGALATGILSTPIGLDVPISYVAAADVAQLAVHALDDPRLDGVVIAVGGPDPVTYRQLLPLISEVSGKDLGYEQTDLSTVEAQMPHVAEMVRLFNAHGFIQEPPPVATELGLKMTDIGTFLHSSGWASPPGGDSSGRGTSE